MTQPSDHKCKDCRAAGRTGPVLDAPFPGPRCYTCNRAFKKAQRSRNHDKHVQRTYGLAPGQYDQLCEFQGGLCAICRKAKCIGASGKHLAVDHNHETGEPRGLLCVRCNHDLLGQYDSLALARAIMYLKMPPYRAMLAASNPSDPEVTP